MAVTTRRNTSPDAVVISEDINIHEGRGWIPSMLRRVSWQAILSGAVVAIMVQFGLNLLGLAIGAGTIDPLYDQDPLQVEVAAATVIWMAASVLIALFAGGLVAGRMAGMLDHTDGALHGLVVWAVVSIISILLLNSAVGSIIGTASNLLSSGVDLAGQSLAAVAPEAAEALELQEIRLQGIQEEARQILNLEEAAPATTDGVEEDSTAVTQEQSAIQRELNLVIARLLRQEEPVDIDRQAVVTMLVERGNMTQEEAQATVSDWEQNYRQFVTEAETTIREVGQGVADSIAVIAGVLFAILVLGAFAAGAGGLVGTPGDVPVTKVDVDNPATT